MKKVILKLIKKMNSEEIQQAKDILISNGYEIIKPKQKICVGMKILIKEENLTLTISGSELFYRLHCFLNLIQ